MAMPQTKEEKAEEAKKAEEVKAPNSTKKKTMVVAEKTTVTNPYTKDVFSKGIPRDTPKKKDSWYKCQLDAGYLKEVKV